MKAQTKQLPHHLVEDAGRTQVGKSEIPVEVVILSVLTLKVLVTTINAQWEGMGDVGSAK